MTSRAIKNIFQSETTVKSWWHESEDPNGLDQRLSFLGSQRFVRIKKIKEAVRVAKFAKKEWKKASDTRVNMPGIALFLDFQKVFDTIERNSLTTT